MLEFTGERLVPGKVAPELWNEHLSRYLFATRLARHKRVLEIACGAGYGAAELARVADCVVALDVAHDAVVAAKTSYATPNQRYLTASAEAIPLRSGSFDLIVAYEVIEHLPSWTALIEEAKRLLAPGGQFIVSTPNKSYYADTRKQVGPNPFHVHEFEYEEFENALKETFPAVRIFSQNHVSAIAFAPASGDAASPAELALQRSQPEPHTAHYFLAVCAASPQTGSPTFVYVPSTGNILQERGLHIEKLEGEVAQKDIWIEELKNDRSRLSKMYTKQMVEYEKTQRWAKSLDAELKTARERLQALQQEHAEAMDRYQGIVDQLNQELIERTNWTLSLQEKVTSLEQKVALTACSRWVRLGRKFGVGPDLEGDIAPADRT